MGKIKVSDAHDDHYIKLEAVDGETVAWWDGFTGLTVVVSEVGMGIRGAIGASHLVSVIDRHSQQTWAWAFNSLSDVHYITGKIPTKAFNKTWRQRLAESVALMLRLHDQAVGVARSA